MSYTRLLLLLLLLITLLPLHAAAHGPDDPNAASFEQNTPTDSQPLAYTPLAITPIPQVQQLINQVDVDHLLGYARELSGETPALINGQSVTIPTRSTYSGAHLQNAVQYMSERLQRLGLTVTTHTWNASYAPNIIAEKPGLDPTAGIVILCAHLDSTSPSGATLAPGADDNGSGSVAVLQAAELMAPYHFNATVRFILFTGEEQGLLGSTAYANAVAGQDIRGVLNMDMIAWDNQGGPDMDLHARSSVAGSVSLGTLYADVINAYALPLIPVIYGNGSSASDHSPFWNIGVPAILAIENYNADIAAPRDFNAYYHSVNDRVSAFNTTFFRTMTQASLATFIHMAGLNTTCYWADLDCSGLVDVLDLSQVASSWQAGSGQWNYSLAYDPDVNGTVDVLDIQRFAAEWGWAGK
ncbi:MAG: M28 family peptidase [Caldilineales bacterium]